jgi:hypothetical protein
MLTRWKRSATSNSLRGRYHRTLRARSPHSVMVPGTAPIAQKGFPPNCQSTTPTGRSQLLVPSRAVDYTLPSMQLLEDQSEGPRCELQILSCLYLP